MNIKKVDDKPMVIHTKEKPTARVSLKARLAEKKAQVAGKRKAAEHGMMCCVPLLFCNLNGNYRTIC